MSRRTAAKLVAILHGIFEEARSEYGLTGNPARDVPRRKLDYQASALEFPFYEPEQVYAFARAAANQQDGAIYVTAAFSGLRLGELLGLKVCDVDFVGETIRVLAAPSATPTPTRHGCLLVAEVDGVSQFWDGRQPFGTTTHAISMPNAYVGANDTELIL